MLREPTPGFMLDVIERLRREGQPQTHLETNIRWLVTGEKRPIGCPTGHREDKFLERLEIMREKCVKRLAALMLENKEHSILDVLDARLNDGVGNEDRIDEVVFNNSLSMHFENNEEDHALIRWLLEGEFLETEYNGEIDDEPNRTLVNDPDENLVLFGLPLHISSTWAAHGPEGPGTMGPTARLLCYWVRGEYLGSKSVTELDFVTSDQYSDFELRHEATAPQTLLKRNVRPVKLRRRVRLHALSKIEVFTLVTRGDISERWVLRDSSANRYQHGLSESLIPGESFLDCAIRGLGEELGVKSSTIDLEPTPYGPTRVEWGDGRERFDSRSMPGLPSIMCINPFYVRFDSEPGSDDHDFVDLQDGIPRRQFFIDDAGGTTLNWLPDPANLNLGETLALIGDDQDIQTNQWYALNYPGLRSEPDTKAHTMITAIIGTTLLYHHRTDRPHELIQPENGGLLYTGSLWTRNGKGKLGVANFEKRNSGVSELVGSLVINGIFDPYKADDPDKKGKFESFLSSIGRLLQPEINWQFSGEDSQRKLADEWMIKWIQDARRGKNLSDFDSRSIEQLLPWNPTVNSNQLLSNWQRALEDELFAQLNNPELWGFDGTLASLLRNQPDLEGPRTIILFKRLDDGSFDVKLQEKVNLPVAQLHSALLNHLRRREEEQSSLDTLDEVTFGSIRDTVNELRERHAMVVRLD